MDRNDRKYFPVKIICSILLSVIAAAQSSLSMARADPPANAAIEPFSAQIVRMRKNEANLKKLADAAPTIGAQTFGDGVDVVRFVPDWIGLGAYVTPVGLMYVIYSPPPPAGTTTREYPEAIGTLSRGTIHRIDMPIPYYSMTFNGTVGGKVVITGGGPTDPDTVLDGMSAKTMTRQAKDPESIITDNLGFLSDKAHCLRGDLKTSTAVYAVDDAGHRRQFLSTDELERAARGLVDMNELEITCATFAGRNYVSVGDISRTIFRIDSGRASIVAAGLLLGSGEHHLLIRERGSGDYVEASN